jgi:hypothetical protein
MNHLPHHLAYNQHLNFGFSMVAHVHMNVTALENIAWTIMVASSLLLDCQFHFASREYGMITPWIPAEQRNQQNNYMQQVLSHVTMSGSTVKVKTALPRVTTDLFCHTFLNSLCA